MVRLGKYGFVNGQQSEIDFLLFFYSKEIIKQQDICLTRCWVGAPGGGGAVVAATVVAKTATARLAVYQMATVRCVWHWQCHLS